MADKDIKEKTATTVPVKLFTREEVLKQSTLENSDTWIIIHNEIYNVTSFLNEHPGGEEVLLEQNGLDATEAFEDIGHSSDARELMISFKIGELVEFLAFLVNSHCTWGACYPCLSLLHQHALNRIPTKVQQVPFSVLLVNMYINQLLYNRSVQVYIMQHYNCFL
ncbi:cytochrome b5 isoform X1 [Harpegnathos saltator]|uniref:cytochrome b5 isoform X1 n=1 Tax=Harpegnathos saltator TaxID=610380 RepID=UPI000DBED22F|nr:cytochrome b5 isoform X1 [Harpegnathos saltator]